MSDDADYLRNVAIPFGAHIRGALDKIADRIDEQQYRLGTLTAALQKIVDRRFVGYVEAQEIAREALSGPAPSAPSKGEKP